MVKSSKVSGFEPLNELLHISSTPDLQIVGFEKEKQTRTPEESHKRTRTLGIS